MCNAPLIDEQSVLPRVPFQDITNQGEKNSKLASVAQSQENGVLYDETAQNPTTEILNLLHNLLTYVEELTPQNITKEMTADEEISVLKDAIVIDVPGDPQLDPKSVSQDYQSTLSVETSGDAVLSFEDNFVQDTNVLEESDVITSFVDLTQEQSAQMAKWIEDSLEREMNAVSHDSAPIDYVNPLTAPDSLTEETGDDFNEDEPIGSGSTEKELNGGGRKWETHITYCSLCSKDVTHFPDHLKTYHKDEDDVKDMIKYQVIFAEHNRIVKMIKGASEEEQQKRQEDLLESQKKV
nr:PREDICTED: uncharacterized protein LOC109035506 [Bemisia tabaci]